MKKVESIKELREICYKDYTWYRTFSIYITKALIRTKVTPTDVTIFHNIMGLIAVGLLFGNNYWFDIIAGILLIGVKIVDCVDGELARYHKKYSIRGYYLDLVVGNFIVNFMVPGALAIRYADNPILLTAGILTIIGIAMKDYAHLIFMRIAPKKPETEKKKTPKSLKWYSYIRKLSLVDSPQDAFLIAAILGLVPILLVIQAISFNFLWMAKMVHTWVTEE
jgi:phosphatidylglycerophosphate synthase